MSTLRTIAAGMLDVTEVLSMLRGQVVEDAITPACAYSLLNIVVPELERLKDAVDELYAAEQRNSSRSARKVRAELKAVE